MLSFLFGAACAVVAFALMPPQLASSLSWLVRDKLYDLRAWWASAKRRGGE